MIEFFLTIFSCTFYCLGSDFSLSGEKFLSVHNFHDFKYTGKIIVVLVIGNFIDLKWEQTSLESPFLGSSINYLLLFLIG